MNRILLRLNIGLAVVCALLLAVIVWSDSVDEAELPDGDAAVVHLLIGILRYNFVTGKNPFFNCTFFENFNELMIWTVFGKLWMLL